MEVEVCVWAVFYENEAIMQQVGCDLALLIRYQNGEAVATIT